MNLLLFDESELVDNKATLKASDSRSKHIRRVLRLGGGDTVRAGIVDGSVGEATIVRVDGNAVVLSFAPQTETESEADRIPGVPLERTRVRVDLLLGHPRPIVLKRMIRDLCTIGIETLSVVPTELGERSYLESNMWDSVRTYLIDGASQAGTTRITDVTCYRSFAAGLESLTDQTDSRSLRVALHPGGRPYRAALAKARTDRVVLAIGSERGWTDSELGLLSDSGFDLASLGASTLRTETAALVACWAAANGGDEP